MGCDIHLVLERKTDAGWVGLNSFEMHHDRNAEYSFPIAGDRNYGRFAALAGVRGDGPQAIGLPDDISALTAELVREWDGDGHSHSWMPLKSAAKIFAETESFGAKRGERDPIEYYFGVYFDGGRSATSVEDYRIVFWFDN